MLLRRALLSGTEIPNTVTIPLLGSFAASNGAVPSVNSGCTLTDTGLYIPTGQIVEYKLSDLYPKDWSKLTLEMDLMYTKTSHAHGWFDFFDTHAPYPYSYGVDYNKTPRELFLLPDCVTVKAIPKNTYLHVIIVADFAQGDTCPHSEITGINTAPRSPYPIAKPSAIILGVKDDTFDGWQGYARNVKVTFE